MMKLNALLSRLALVTVALPLGSVMAEDCNTSYYCYGNYVNFQRINVVVSDQPGSTAININPERIVPSRNDDEPSPVAPSAPNANPRNVPNRPLTVPAPAPRVANPTACRAQYDEQLAKAAKLDALAQAQAKRGQQEQAQRLFSTAAQLRSVANRMNCR